MSKWLFSALALTLTPGLFLQGPSGCEGDDGPPAGSTFIDFDVLKYDYVFDIETRQAISTVTVRALSSGNCITLDYELPGVSGLQWQGGPPTWSDQDGETLSYCGSGVTLGQTLTLKAVMSLPVNGALAQEDIGYNEFEDRQGAVEHYYLMSWFEGCAKLGPCYASPDDMAEVNFTVYHPVGYQLLCPGALTQGTTESSCAMGFEAPTYTGFGAALSASWIPRLLGTQDGVDIVFYDLPEADALSFLDLDTFLDAFAWLSDLLGPYPYGDELRFHVGPYYWWGLEHPGNIAIAQDLPGTSGSYQDPLLHVLIHETAHMWAGNQTTIAGLYDFVWKEAIVEYLTFVYEDENLSPSYALRTLRIWVSNTTLSSAYPVPLGEPELLDYYGDVYGTGPFILFRQLEGLFGRAPILRAAQRVLSEGGFLSVEELKIVLEEETGANLDEYFEEWVYGDGSPRWPVVALRFDDNDGDGTWRVEVTQVQDTPHVYGFKSTLRVKGAESGQAVELPFSYGVDGISASLTLEVTPGFDIVDIDVDPFDEAIVTEQGVDGGRDSMMIDGVPIAPFRPF